MAASAATNLEMRSFAALFSILNSLSFLGAMEWLSILNIFESNGGDVIRAVKKASRASVEPSISICTHPLSLRTNPLSRCRWAKLNMKGRKPTPCTTPETRIRRLSIVVLLGIANISQR